MPLTMAAAFIVGCVAMQSKIARDDRPMASSAMDGAESLGDDVLLISIPSDDNTLAGKVHIPRQRDNLTEVDFQANPCRDHLNILVFEANRKVSDIRRLDVGINASAMIKAFRIKSEMSRVTDYQYEFLITRKMVADDTVEYAECCAGRRGGCGSHFVRELYYGSGTYKLLKATAGGAEVSVPVVASAGGNVSYVTLGEQSFKGFFAYKTKETPAPSPEQIESRVSTVSTDGAQDFNLPKTLDGAAVVEQQGAYVLLESKSDERHQDNQLKAIGSARKKQRRALRNLLMGPPFNTPQDQLDKRVNTVYQKGEEVDAYEDDKGNWYLKMRYRIK